MNAAATLVLMVCTAVLSGIALFSGSARVNAVTIDIVFLLSTAAALVAAIRIVLARLAKTAEGAESSIVSEVKAEAGARTSMNGDSQADHSEFIPQTEDVKNAALRGADRPRGHVTMTRSNL